MVKEDRLTIPYEKMIHHTLQEDTLASSQFKLQAGPIHRDCRVVLKRLSTADILKWQRPDKASSELRRLLEKCSEPVNPSAFSYPSDKSAAAHSSQDSHQAPGSSFIPPEQPIHTLNRKYRAVDHLSPFPVPSLDPPSTNEQRLVELEKTVAWLKAQVIDMAAIMSSQRKKLDTLKRDWARKHRKLNQMEETLQKLKVQLKKENKSPGCGPVRKNPHNRQHQTINRASEPDPTSKSLRRHCGKRKLQADFSLIYYALEQNMVSNSVEPKRGPSKGVNQAQILPGNQTAHSEISKLNTQNVFQNSQLLDRETSSHSSESMKIEPIPPKRIRVIKNQKLLENVTAFPENTGSQEEGALGKGNVAGDLIHPRPNESVPLSGVSEHLKSPIQTYVKTESKQTAAQLSAFPKGWFKRVPASVRKPPAPYHGCCLSCYELTVEIRNQHCETCRSKMKTLRHDYLKNPNTAIPRCTHQLNQPMRGCEACIIRAFVLRYNFRNPNKSFTIPYDKVDCLVQRTSQQVLPGSASTHIQNTPQDVISHLSIWPKQSKQPKHVLDVLDSLAYKICQELLPGPVPNQIQNTPQDLTVPLSSLPKQCKPPKRKIGFDEVGSLNRKTCQQVVPSLASSKIQNTPQNVISHPSIMRRPSEQSKQKMCSKVDYSVQRTYQQPGLASNQIQNTLHDNKSYPFSSSPEQSEEPKQKIVSAFPNDWFLVVPNFANKPPTPYADCCYSCYEYNERLIQQFCKTCWFKAKRLKDNYLKDPNIPNPRCIHQLNLPMRGCDACVLRAFVVRYNLRNPDACFAVPYSKVDQVITDDPTNNNIQSPFTALLHDLLQNCGSMVERTSEQQVEPDAASSRIQNKPIDVTSLLSSMPKQWEPPRRSGFITDFPENWFLAVPDDVNERPTPRFNQCVSCYEFKRTHGKQGHCETCRTKANIIKDRYLENSNTPLPQCTHQLNRPMRCCDSCFLRAYILTYNISNPDEPYDIPYDKIDFGCQLLKNRPNIKHAPLSDSCELSIVSTQTLQSQPYPKTVFFPDSWFQKVPTDAYELPTPRCGCCLSCYEYKIRVGGYCSGCISKAMVLKNAYQKDPNTPIPQCTHQLNRPLRGCEVCIIRAYILRYNRSNPKKLFEIPYEMVDVRIPADRIHQLIQPEKVFHQENHLQPQAPMDVSIDQGQLKSPQNETSAVSSLNINFGFSADRTLQVVERERLIDVVQHASVPPIDDAHLSLHQVKGTWTVRISVPFPPNWFLEVSSDPNVPPTPRPDHCVSCYEMQTIPRPYCRKCLSRLQRLLNNPKKPVPLCKHRLNQPMRNCFGCFIRAFTFDFEQRSGYKIFNQLIAQ